MRFGQVVFVFLLGAMIAIGLTFVALTFASLDTGYHFTHGPGCPDPTYPY